MRELFVTFIFVLALSLALSEPLQIDVSHCGTGFDDLVCTIDDVKVDECKIDRATKACKLKRGSNYTMNVNFTPDFEGNDVTMLAYALLPGVDAEFQGMDEDACHWMNCPVVKNVQQTYQFILSMSKNYPRGLFNVRWLMKQSGVPKCCFTNRFKIE